ncbi:Disks large 1 [Lonchura striata]|uniref:Disks large 1 n=1 Tax=Lonchura striata TaxID=40157 RepID=A0A218UKJ4_9PASE|nr:Disks large 1 [Lonchura striata domestica]
MIRREDTERAVEILTRYQSTLQSPEEQELKASIGKVSHIFQSELFQALLDIHEFYDFTLRSAPVQSPSLDACHGTARQHLGSSEPSSTVTPREPQNLPEDCSWDPLYCNVNRAKATMTCFSQDDACQVDCLSTQMLAGTGNFSLLVRIWVCCKEPCGMQRAATKEEVPTAMKTVVHDVIVMGKGRLLADMGLLTELGPKMALGKACGTGEASLGGHCRVPAA